MEWMLEQKEPSEAWRSLLLRTPATELHQACMHYRESRRLEQTGYVGILRERLRWQIRPYLPEFLQLPFQAEVGATGLQEALASASVYFRDKTLPSHTTPVEFLPAAFGGNYSMPMAMSSRRYGNSVWRSRFGMPCAHANCT